MVGCSSAVSFRRLLFVVFLAFLMVGPACDNRVPVAPSDGTLPVSATVEPGSYFLRFAVSSAGELGPEGGPGQINSFACATILTGAGAPPPEQISLPILLQQSAGGWEGRLDDPRAGTLRLSLQVTDHSASGTVTGYAQHGEVGVTLSDSGSQGPALLSGYGLAGREIAGQVSGKVQFSSTGGSTSCNANAWSLAPR